MACTKQDAFSKPVRMLIRLNVTNKLRKRFACIDSRNVSLSINANDNLWATEISTKISLFRNTAQHISIFAEEGSVILKT